MHNNILKSKLSSKFSKCQISWTRLTKLNFTSNEIDHKIKYSQFFTGKPHTVAVELTSSRRMSTVAPCPRHSCDGIGYRVLHTSRLVVTSLAVGLLPRRGCDVTSRNCKGSPCLCRTPSPWMRPGSTRTTLTQPLDTLLVKGTFGAHLQRNPPWFLVRSQQKTSINNRLGRTMYKFQTKVGVR